MKIRVAKILRRIGEMDGESIGMFLLGFVTVEFFGWLAGGMLGAIVHSDWVSFYTGYAIGGLFWFPLALLALYGLWVLFRWAIAWGTHFADEVDFEERSWARGDKR